MKKHSFIARGSIASLLALCMVIGVAQSASALADSFKKTDDSLKNDPAKRVAFNKEYLSSHPELRIDRRAQIYKQIAVIYDGTLHDTPSALAALNTGLAETAKLPADKPVVSSPVDVAVCYLAGAKARILSKTSHEKAVAALDASEPALLNLLKGDTSIPNFFAKRIFIYTNNVPQSQQAQKIAPLIEKGLQLRPYYSGDAHWMTLLVGYLNEQRQTETALSYAKLAWMMCPFDQKSISDATGLMTTTWLAKDLNMTHSNSFVKAQQDSTAPNPLADIKLPSFDATTMDALLKGLATNDTTDRITLLLIEGKMGEAMLMARRDLLEHAGTNNSKAVLEIARVFKASDLNVLRANAFLQYLQTGKGTNPLDAFFKEHPLQPAAAK